MELVTLNTWGGRVRNDLEAFLKARQDIDIFCFQEVYHEATHVHVEQGGLDPNLQLFQQFQALLPEHIGYFRAHYLETYGLATFVRKEIPVVKEEECFVHHYKGFIPEERVGNHARNVQALTLEAGGPLHIFNFHGLWNGGGKGDSEDRLSQSHKMSEFIRSYPKRKILCGDFNLAPDTESLKLVEEIPLRNLVKEHDITSTRTSYYPKDMRYADYILVDDAIGVQNFQVLPEEVSDHSALYLEFA